MMRRWLLTICCAGLVTALVSLVASVFGPWVGMERIRASHYTNWHLAAAGGIVDFQYQHTSVLNNARPRNKLGYGAGMEVLPVSRIWPHADSSSVPGLTMFRLSLPVYLPALLCALYPAWVALPARRRLARAHTGLCQKCGYDIRGIAQRCPECGHAIGPPPRSTEANLRFIALGIVWLIAVAVLFTHKRLGTPSWIGHGAAIVALGLGIPYLIRLAHKASYTASEEHRDASARPAEPGNPSADDPEIGHGHRPGPES